MKGSAALLHAQLDEPLTIAGAGGPSPSRPMATCLQRL